MKSVLLNTTVIGSPVKMPRHPKLIIGEPGKYLHGDILDANAVTKEISDAVKNVVIGEIDIQRLLQELREELLAAIDERINQLINDAPEEYDTLGEIAAATEEHTAWHNT